MSKMKPEKIGRSFGVGIRVAGKVLGESLSGTSQAASTVGESMNGSVRAGNAEAAKARGELVGRAARGTGRGVGGFLRPFARIGGILWLEVTGAIFFLFALFFALNLWRMRSDIASGPQHTTFLLTAFFLIIFIYLGASAFWRARRK
jgi:hypothetical protein